MKIEVGEDQQFRTMMSGLEITFILTEKGVGQYQTVIAALFKYIEMLK